MNKTYARVGLKHIGVNVDSKDNEPRRRTAQVVMQNLTPAGRGSDRHQAATPHLIVLFHDINNTTAASIGIYIEHHRRGREGGRPDAGVHRIGQGRDGYLPCDRNLDLPGPRASHPRLHRRRRWATG